VHRYRIYRRNSRGSWDFVHGSDVADFVLKFIEQHPGEWEVREVVEHVVATKRQVTETTLTK
jgi:nucleoside-diphosphate-sugar epimerase